LVDSVESMMMHGLANPKQNIVLNEQHDTRSPTSPYIKHYTPFAKNVSKRRITTNYFSLPIFMTVYKNLPSPWYIITFHWRKKDLWNYLNWMCMLA